MSPSQTEFDPGMTISRLAKAATEAADLLRTPQRIFPLVRVLTSDQLSVIFSRRTLYSYASTRRQTDDALHSLLNWILHAQRPDGGIAAYYSLLRGYSESYPEVTGYLIPTLYDFAHSTGNQSARMTAESATNWLLSLQMPCGAFPAGLQGADPQPSVFNTGQILQGLLRAYRETRRSDIRMAALSAGDWLVQAQRSDGSWSGPGAYLGVSHTYYSMVSWALAGLSEMADDERYGLAAEKNLDWVLRHFQPNGWVEGLNLRGHPSYLHFVAYVLQGVLECALLSKRADAIRPVEKPAWLLLRKFEINKFLPGAYGQGFQSAYRFTCLTGNAQMSCVWLRLFEHTGDLRYLNAALKMNEMLKQLLRSRGGRGIVGGVSGSYPVWGPYQPLRYISWGCKFLADALMLEQKLMWQFEALACAS